MGKVLIVYASRANETKGIAEVIAEGVRLSGHEPCIKKAVDIKTEEDLKGYDGYAFGSPTYHGDMLSPMKQVLFIAERADLKDKPGGTFGAYGWSGEAGVRLFETMSHIFGMKMVSDPLMLKASWVEGGIEAAQDYGASVAALI